MKRLVPLLMLCLLLCSSCAPEEEIESPDVVETFSYLNEELGFSLTLENISAGDIAVEECENGVAFFHTPSRADYGGQICTIEVIAPRSDFFAKGYDDISRTIVAMGKDRIFLLKSPGGGVNSGGDYLEEFQQVAAAFSVESLRLHLVPADPDPIPTLSRERHRAYLPPTDGKHIRPDDSLSRGELAQMLFNLLDADNKDAACDITFPDTAELQCAQAVAYLASYGIFPGYDDGTFRPDAPVSRADFAVLLHRVQFAAPVGQYGEGILLADVPDTYWAYDDIVSAILLEWMDCKSDGLFHPEEAITRAQAVTAINRLLGRDESAILVSAEENPFQDLDSSHWAYGNLLEAAGILTDPITDKGVVPQEADTYSYLDETFGWFVNDRQLSRTTDGGKSWTSVGDQLPCIATAVHFFDEQRGVLLGQTTDCPLVLLGTADGGAKWFDILTNDAAVKRHLPARQISNREILIQNVISASLRPAGEHSVYLTVQFVPYESIYVPNLQAIKQSAITLDEIKQILGGQL